LIVVANNFSWLIFQERSSLLSYFKSVCDQGLKEDGAFAIDLYGGPGAETPQVEDLGIGWFKRKDSGRSVRFTATWEQASFDPATRRVINHINFAFPDGSRLPHAYTYDWRLWELDDVKECLYEAGFEKVLVYFEGVDEEDGELNGELGEPSDGLPEYTEEVDWFRAQIMAFKGPPKEVMTHDPSVE